MANQSAVLQKCFTGQFTKDSKNTQKDNTKNYSKIDSGRLKFLMFRNKWEIINISEEYADDEVQQE